MSRGKIDIDICGLQENCLIFSYPSTLSSLFIAFKLTLCGKRIPLLTCRPPIISKAFALSCLVVTVPLAAAVVVFLVADLAYAVTPRSRLPEAILFISSRVWVVTTWAPSEGAIWAKPLMIMIMKMLMLMIMKRFCNERSLLK